MGRATILYGIETGLYRIQLDLGSEKKAAELARLTELIGKLDQRITQANTELTKEQDKEVPLVQAVEAAIAAYQIELQNSKPGSKPPEPKAYIEALKKLKEQQGKTLAAKTLRDLIVKAKLDNLKQIAYWTSFEPFQERNAWGLGFYGFDPPGTVYGTIDIPGDDQAVVLKASVATDADGRLFATNVMSPEQAYLNAAILPGWQRHTPFYRKGTITSINRAENSCSITLDAEASMAQGLNVNELSSLTDVPFVYGPCGNEPFVNGDKVIVEFLENDWLQPRVIGFYGPIQHPCPTYGDISVSVGYQYKQRSGQLDGKVWDQIKKWCLGYIYSAYGFQIGRYRMAARCKLYEFFLKISSATPLQSTTGIIEGHTEREISFGFHDWLFTNFDSTIPSNFQYIMPNNDGPVRIVGVDYVNGTTKIDIVRRSYPVSQFTYDTEEIFTYDEDLGIDLVSSGNPDTGPRFELQSIYNDRATAPSDPTGLYGVTTTYEFPSVDEKEAGSVESIFGIPNIKVNYRGRKMAYKLSSVTGNSNPPFISTSYDFMFLYFTPVGYEDS